jgi:di- and tripeptidase
MGDGAGDLFSLVWVSSLQTIFIGCQNTSLQWYNFNDFATTRLSISGSPEEISRIVTDAGTSEIPTASTSTATAPAIGTGTAGTAGTVTPSSSSRRAHKFFDSYPQYERKPADIFANNQAPGRASPDSLRSVSTFTGDYLDIPPTNVIDSAHYGYIYTMAVLVRSEKEILLATGSGDETVKVRSVAMDAVLQTILMTTFQLWKVGDDVSEPELVHEFECNHGAVLALVARGDTIYAGCQDGYVRVFDLETKTLVRTIIVHEVCFICLL